MGLVLLTTRLLLALVFVVAGLAKLADRSGSQQALRDFGVPTLLAAPLGILLPLAELAVAVALVPTVSAWWGAVGALLLLLLFSAGISYNLAHGRTPQCHCFGQLHSAPVGWPTLLRNLVLAAIAGFIVGLGRVNIGPSAVSWLGTLTTVQRIGLLVGVILAVLLMALGWILVQVLRQQGRLLLRLEAVEKQLAAGGGAPTRALAGLPIGTLAPAFRLTGPADLCGPGLRPLPGAPARNRALAAHLRRQARPGHPQCRHARGQPQGSPAGSYARAVAAGP
jgi:Methylamine utilisation protein MauE